MRTSPIVEYLRHHGQLLDLEIAAAMKIPIQKVRISLSALSARGEIMTCKVTRFNDGNQVEGTLCRVAGYIPPSAPDRKPEIAEMLS